MPDSKVIDISKGIGILLVLIGHSNFGQTLPTIIYTFHLPLFFFINGYLFHYSKYKQSFSGFVSKKWKRLVIPFFVTNFIALSAYILLDWINTRSFSTVNYIVTSSIEVLYGNGAPVSPPLLITSAVDTPSWFLMCLFCGSLILYAFAYFHDKYGLNISLYLSALIVLFGFEVNKYIFLPWSLDIACVSIIFMVPGYLTHYKFRQLISSHKNNALLLFLLLMLFSLVVLLNGRIDMNERIYGNLLLFSIGGLSGTYLTIKFAEKISSGSNALIEPLVFLGKNSMIIFLYQAFSLDIFNRFINIFFNIEDHFSNPPVIHLLGMLAFSLITVIIIQKTQILHRVYY